MKVWPWAMGIGVAAGAMTAMMLPPHSSAKKMVTKAAGKVEDAATQVAEKVLDEITG